MSDCIACHEEFPHCPLFILGETDAEQLVCISRGLKFCSVSLEGPSSFPPEVNADLLLVAIRRCFNPEGSVISTRLHERSIDDGSESFNSTRWGVWEITSIPL